MCFLLNGLLTSFLRLGVASSWYASPWKRIYIYIKKINSSWFYHEFIMLNSTNFFPTNLWLHCCHRCNGRDIARMTDSALGHLQAVALVLGRDALGNGPGGADGDAHLLQLLHVFADDWGRRSRLVIIAIRVVLRFLGLLFSCKMKMNIFSMFFSWFYHDFVTILPSKTDMHSGHVMRMVTSHPFKPTSLTFHVTPPALFAPECGHRK